MISHGACGQQWFGQRTCHCGGCHLNFSSISTFNQHQKGGSCQSPADVGLVPVEKPWGVVWAAPQGKPWWKKEEDDDEPDVEVDP